MRILFDQGTPVPLRHYLSGRVVKTTFEPGWAQLVNGELLVRADHQFDVFVTTDKNLRYQQNLAGRQIAILVLPFASWPRLEARSQDITSAIDRLAPGVYLEFQ